MASLETLRPTFSHSIRRWKPRRPSFESLLEITTGVYWRVLTISGRCRSVAWKASRVWTGAVLLNSVNLLGVFKKDVQKSGNKHLLVVISALGG